MAACSFAREAGAYFFFLAGAFFAGALAGAFLAAGFLAGAFMVVSPSFESPMRFGLIATRLGRVPCQCGEIQARPQTDFSGDGYRKFR
jgi:hypothetical protein